MSVLSSPQAEALPSTIEYGDPRSRTHAAQAVVLADAPHPKARYSAISFLHQTAGYVPAGSAMTYQKECFKVNWWDETQNTKHGQSFKPEDRKGAEDYFNKVRDQEKPVTRYEGKETLPAIPSVPHLPMVSDTVSSSRQVGR